MHGDLHAALVWVTAAAALAPLQAAEGWIGFR